ncbi:MAG: PQQ-binding-like beta-propeller repeat protein [Fuerstiella sp.]|nr:PQQ-binding-like beta-propeller repeat protein [Fuerstiella sp.]
MTDQNSTTFNVSATDNPFAAESIAPTGIRSLRIWPAILLLSGMLVGRYLNGAVEDGPAYLWMVSAFGPMLCGILILLWWLLASRATWKERVLGFAGAVSAFALTMVLLDKSMRGPAMMGLTIPMGTAGFALGAIIAARRPALRRTSVALGLATLGFGFSTLLSSDGMWGDFAVELRWRWEKTAEERLLENAERRILDDFEAQDLLSESLLSPEWPEFRGIGRTGRQRGPRLNRDWNASPPQERWKIDVGPGWSSFAVAGSSLFTQEQRGANETIVCYDANSGLEIWTHAVEGRLQDPLGGPGPRATPTLSEGRLFVTCATGPVLRLDPLIGKLVWKIDLREVADRKPPMWGFCSSPLVVGAAVVVHAGGTGDKGTIALNVATGKVEWSAPAGEHSYSSPQLSIVAGDEQILMLTNEGLDLIDPGSGAIRLNYPWKHKGYRSLQPPVVDENSILLPTGAGSGTRRIRISKSGSSLQAKEVWTSRQLKPDFNDGIVFDGHYYGFDGSIFTCINLSTGQRTWKGGRYGKGQALLLENSRIVLVVSETGEVVLLNASPDSHKELCRFQAIEGKTWNHPVVVGNLLFIRNAQKAACFELAVTDSSG